MTYRLGGGRSIHLSYSPKPLLYYLAYIILVEPGFSPLEAIDRPPVVAH